MPRYANSVFMGGRVEDFRGKRNRQLASVETHFSIETSSKEAGGTIGSN